MKTTTTRKKWLTVLSLIFMAIGIFFVIDGRDKTYAQQQIINCPISKRVPIGSTLDQMVYSIDVLVTDIKSMISYAGLASQAAETLVSTVRTGCKTDNCQSACLSGTITENCDANCPASYTCNYVGRVGGLSGMVRGCSSMTLFPADSDSTYAKYAYYSTIFHTGGTCYSCTTQTPTCDIKPCEKKPGIEACPFTLIGQIIGNIINNRIAVNNARIRINNFFIKPILGFPVPSGDASLFGLFCGNQLFTGCLTACMTTEYKALACLEYNSINNIAKCDIIRPEDLLSGRKGEMLLRCRDYESVPNCQPDLYNDFFCCSTE